MFGRNFLSGPKIQAKMKSHWGLHWERAAVMHFPSKDKGLVTLRWEWACYNFKGRNWWVHGELSWILKIAHSFTKLYPHAMKKAFFILIFKIIKSLREKLSSLILEIKSPRRKLIFAGSQNPAGNLCFWLNLGL